jgi:hypothetical protein
VTNRRKTTQIVLAARPYVMITSLVTTLAAGVGGCASSLERNGHASGLDNGINASVQIPPSATKGRFDASYYTGQAKDVGAPEDWAAHAGSMTIAIESQRALAEATRIRASADHAATLAEANQLLTEALSVFEQQSAAARQIQTAAQANFAAQEKEVTARMAAFDAQHESALLEAQAQLDAAVLRSERMREQAERRYELARADYERLVSESEAYAAHARATIEQIRASSGTAFSQAQTQAEELRAQARATQATAAAQWQALEEQADTIRDWAESRYTELVKEASAVREQASGQVERLAAEADAIAEWELDEKYDSEIVSAQAQYDTATARVALLRESTTGELASAASAFTTERQNLLAQIEKDGQAYEAELARIISDARIAESRASISRARAQELLHDARAQFILETAKALGGRTQAEKAHSFEQAQGWADTVASDRNTSLLARAGTLDTPEMRSAIEAFVAQIAESSEIEREAEAMFDRLQQRAVMRRSEIEVWWTEAKAASETAIEGITYAETETVERMRQQLADAEEIEARASIELAQAQRSIESVRVQAQSRMDELHREAEFAAREGQVRSDEILAQAESDQAQGQEQAESFMRKSEAVRDEAQAQVQALNARAEQILADAQASAAQFAIMARQAEESLTPELDKRGADAARLLTEAELDRDQALQTSVTAESMAEATHVQTVAALEFAAQSFASDMEEKLAQANATREGALSQAEQVLSEATASYAAFQADDAVRRAQAQAVEAALLAFVDERHAVADAQDAAVFAEFSARLATFAADRDRTYADAYFKDFLTQANLSPSDLKRYVEAAEAALGRLRQASSTQVPVLTAQDQAGNGDHAANAESVELLEVESMSANGVASVPTIDDE